MFTIKDICPELLLYIKKYGSSRIIRILHKSCRYTNKVFPYRFAKRMYINVYYGHYKHSIKIIARTEGTKTIFYDCCCHIYTIENGFVYDEKYNYAVLYSTQYGAYFSKYENYKINSFMRTYIPFILLKFTGFSLENLRFYDILSKNYNKVEICISKPSQDIYPHLNIDKNVFPFFNGVYQCNDEQKLIMICKDFIDGIRQIAKEQNISENPDFYGDKYKMDLKSSFIDIKWLPYGKKYIMIPNNRGSYPFQERDRFLFEDNEILRFHSNV